MSGPGYIPAPQMGAWPRYIAKEHAARDAYLATVEHAHREYLTGPWPDRESYNHVESSAWVTYYAAGRAAWRHYTAEITPPPPPPANDQHVPIPVYPSDHRTDQEAQFPRVPQYLPRTETER